MTLRALVSALALSALPFVIACEESAPEPDVHLPSETQFPVVLDAMERRCATLDCHGAPGRNLRLYTGSGLRLNPKDIPGTGQTTEAEYDASYWSVYGLEPEIMNAVIADDGEDPERLALIRKARGTESHKPGALMEEGDDLDDCLTSWLKSKVNEPACKKAQNYGAPEN